MRRMSRRHLEWPLPHFPRQNAEEASQRASRKGLALQGQLARVPLGAMDFKKPNFHISDHEK